ncbi:CLUMA_CG003588, isoform A [Clunio marinus]|uniref:CLUMA_CG003588, isoform A n=1 Tax=Clunio marinus TaxID=568069 RepID=A0A1J1HP70_9DIPT|nr:CLUMA_CG003588, isoform A [Clunio marinus]
MRPCRHDFARVKYTQNLFLFNSLASCLRRLWFIPSTMRKVLKSKGEMLTITQRTSIVTEANITRKPFD